MARNSKLRPFERADFKLARRVALDQRSTAGRIVAWFAELGDQPPMAALSGGVVAAGLVRRDERLARVGLRMLLAHSLSTMAKLLGKGLVDRTRPGALDEKAYRMEQGASDDGRLRSFPSGHSAGSAAVAAAVAPDFPMAAVPAALAASAIAAAQPASRNHFVSDVVAGVIIGVSVGVIARLLVPPFDEIEQPR